MKKEYWAKLKFFEPCLGYVSYSLITKARSYEEADKNIVHRVVKSLGYSREARWLYKLVWSVVRGNRGTYECEPWMK